MLTLTWRTLGSVTIAAMQLHGDTPQEAEFLEWSGSLAPPIPPTAFSPTSSSRCSDPGLESAAWKRSEVVKVFLAAPGHFADACKSSLGFLWCPSRPCNIETVQSLFNLRHLRRTPEGSPSPFTSPQTLVLTFSPLTWTPALPTLVSNEGFFFAIVAC